MKTPTKLCALSGLLIISVLLSSCGGQTNDSSENAQSSESSESAQSSVNMNSDFAFMNDFRAALNANGVDCTGYVRDKAAFGVREKGTCKYGSTEITLNLFSDASNAAIMVDSLKAFGGYWVVSSNWAIVVDDGDVAKDLQKKLGARIA